LERSRRPFYDASMLVRRVDSNGRISFKNNVVKIGKAFIRETLGIREEKDEGIYVAVQHKSRLTQDNVSFVWENHDESVHDVFVHPKTMSTICTMGEGAGEMADRAMITSNLGKKCTRLNQNRSKQPEKLHGAKL